MKRAFQQVTTPAGILQYPALIEPDTRFDTSGVFKTNIVIPAGEGADDLEETLTNARTAWLASCAKESGGKKVKVNEALPCSRDDENNLVVKAKLPFQVNTKSGKSWQQKPALFDAKGQKVDTTNLRIGSGTRARLALEISTYNQPATGAGISLRLRGVQLIEVVEPKGSSAGDFGFGSEEGFVSETFDNFEDDPKPVKAAAGGKKVKAQDF